MIIYALSIFEYGIKKKEEERFNVRCKNEF